MSKSDIKSLDDDDKDIAAMATWPTVVKILIITAIFYAAMLGCYLIFTLTHDAEDSKSALTCLIILAIVALILSPKSSALLDGFDTIKGYKRLGINPFIEALIAFYVLPLRFVGLFVNLLLSCLNRVSHANMLGMPRLCLPQNCDYDALISYNSALEKQAVAMSNIEMVNSETETIARNRASDLKNEIYELERNTEMDSYEKQKLLDEKRTVLEGYEQTMDILSSGEFDADAKDKLNKTLNSISTYNSEAASRLRDINDSLLDSIYQYEKETTKASTANQIVDDDDDDDADEDYFE